MLCSGFVNDKRANTTTYRCVDTDIGAQHSSNSLRYIPAPCIPRACFLLTFFVFPLVVKLFAGDVGCLGLIRSVRMGDY